MGELHILTYTIEVAFRAPLMTIRVHEYSNKTHVDVDM